MVTGQDIVPAIYGQGLNAIDREAKGKLVKLSEASRACGYTADHLRVLIRAGKLTDCGRLHAPRVRLDELPKKPGHQPGALTPARAVANLQAQIVGNAITASKRRQNGDLT